MLSVLFHHSVSLCAFSAVPLWHVSVLSVCHSIVVFISFSLFAAHVKVSITML